MIRESIYLLLYFFLYISVADAEAAASTLLEELENLLRGDVSAPSPELGASRSTNSKARYQLGILERAVAREIYHQPQQVDPAAPAESPTVTIPAAASGNGVDLPTLDGLSVDKAVALINAGIACTVRRQVGHAELTAAGVARCTDRKAILRRLNADASRRCAAEPHLQQQRQPSRLAIDDLDKLLQHLSVGDKQLIAAEENGEHVHLQSAAYVLEAGLHELSM